MSHCVQFTDKIFDQVILSRYGDKLCTSDLQVGFKRQRSTNMYAMMINESISYTAFIMATKAFDRVEYVKLFTILVHRDILPVSLILLLNMYTGQVTRVAWNGECSRSFSVYNGIKQGGVLSLALFCIYLDGLCR